MRVCKDVSKGSVLERAFSVCRVVLSIFFCCLSPTPGRAPMWAFVALPSHFIYAIVPRLYNGLMSNFICKISEKYKLAWR